MHSTCLVIITISSDYFLKRY